MFRRTQHAFLFAWIALGLSSVVTYGQSIENEFRKVAPKKWLELRKKTFDNCAIAVEVYWQDTSKRAKSDFQRPREVKTRYIQFAMRDFRYYENVPLSDSNPTNSVPFGHRFVTIYNKKQTFMVSKPPKKNWKLLRSEKATKKFEFNPESVEPGWSSRNRRMVYNNLMHSFSMDPRLLSSRTTSLEFIIKSYIEYDEKCFRDFSVRKDKSLGRIVSVKLVMDTDLEDVPRRRPTKAVKLQVRGTFEFLADWYWVPLSLQTTRREFDKDGQEVSVSKSSANFDYRSRISPFQLSGADKKPAQIYPAKVQFKYESPLDGRNHQRSFKIRPLSKTEIESIKKSTDLSDFVPK